MCRILLQLILKAERPINPNLPTKLNTIGDHLRKARIEKGISQKEVAEILKTSDRNVWRWENISRIPTPLYMSRILTFIGYVPINKTTINLGEKLFWARQIAGLTQEEAAVEIGISESTLVFTETHGRITRYADIKKKFNAFIEKQYFIFLKNVTK